MDEDTSTTPRMRYGTAAILLHWSIAALVVADFGLALSFSRFNPGDAWYFRSAYRMHMSVGMAALALSVSCVVWRLKHWDKYPPLPGNMRPMTRVLAKAVHTLLYAFILAVPMTGWIILSARKTAAAMFGGLHWPNIAYLADLTHDQRVQINDYWLPIHAMLAYVGMSIVALHISAALYHHLWRRDEVLTRMLPRRRAQ
jgi:cytochrome b561